MKKNTLIGVRFRKTGKLNYFESATFEIKRGDHVIVKTSKGSEYGMVEIADYEPSGIKPSTSCHIIRIATKEDDKKHEDNLDREIKATQICQNRIEKHGLHMKLIDTELTFDCSKIIFYFTSEQRVDFRRLVKDLAAVFKMRIELRQIGVRDEAKAIGSIGMCGRKLCCSSFLGNFQPVSIKMAKDQGLSLNPSKISGVCGRLMCCLKYEEDVYDTLSESLPKEFDIVKTPNGEGQVVSVNILKQTVKVQIRAKDGTVTLAYYLASEVKVVKKAQPHHENIKMNKELAKLMDS